MVLRTVLASVQYVLSRRLVLWLTVCLLGVIVILSITDSATKLQQQMKQYQQQHPSILNSLLRQLQRDEKDIGRVTSLPQVLNHTVDSSEVKPTDDPVMDNITKPLLYPPGFRLSNLTNFSFVINNDVCGPDPVDLVMVVVSDTRRPSWRAAVRDVLPSAVLAELRIRRVFLLAELAPPANTSAQYDRSVTALQAENHEHADLVVGNFHDSYHNLTYKHLMGLHWASAYCPQAHHIVKMDQDIAVDVFRLHDLLQTMPRRMTIIGTHFIGTKPIRDPASKWFVSKKVFAPDDYPTYMPGSLYVITPDAAALLAAGSPDVPFFWVDDVFVTGVLRERVAPNVTILDFIRIWGRPDSSGRKAAPYTLQMVCLFECAASREAMVAQCDTLFGQTDNNLVVFRMFMKQAEYCHRRPQGCVRRQRMPDRCQGGNPPPLKSGIPQKPKDIWDVS